MGRERAVTGNTKDAQKIYGWMSTMDIQGELKSIQNLTHLIEVANKLIDSKIEAIQKELRGMK